MLHPVRQKEPPMTTRDEIIAAIHALNLQNRPFCIHTAMRSFTEPVEGGADGLLDAFLACGCTVMAPTFSDMYEAPPVPEYMPPQNGAGDYSYFFEKTYEDAGVYTPESNSVTVEEMGVFPQRLLQRQDRVRGGNHLNSFAAVGPLAAGLIAGQTNDDVYAPLARLYDADGCILLVGTGLKCATAIHYAEQRAGRNPFVRWSKDAGGHTIPVRAGGCSEGFGHFDDCLQPFERRIRVGGSLWRCYPLRQLTDACAEVIRRVPAITHCGDSSCSRCNDAVSGGPIL